MGFNPLTQKSARNTVIEYGTVTFSGTSTTVEVPTRLNTVYMGLGVTQTGISPTVTDRVITNGSVTFTRASGTASGDTLNYVLGGI